MGTIAADATVLGFDVGSRRIGVAIGSAFALSARAIAVVEIPAAGIDWVALDRLLAEWRPQGLVVGDPLTLEGEDQPNRKRAHAFARQLLARYALPVVVDERSSSIEAARRFAQQRAAGHKRRRDAASLDAVAAAVIIERWLDAPGDATPVSLAPHVST